MDKNVYSDVALKQYLLGETSEEERDQIEHRYLANKDFFDQMLAVEDDLVDEYVRGELSASEREQFERKLLTTPRQREKLQQTRRLLESMRAHTLDAKRAKKRELEKSTSWFSIFGARRIPAFAGAFVLLLMFVVAAWLFIRERQLNSELQRRQAERAQMQQRQQDLQAKLQDEQREKSELLQQLQNVPQTEQPKESQTAATVATFVLPLTLTRGGREAPSFTLKHDVDMVQLQAPLANDEYKSYQADLQSADGASVYRISKLKTRKTTNRNVLLLRIPARLLKGRDYVLKVSGVAGNGQLEDAGFYSFRIVRN